MLVRRVAVAVLFLSVAGTALGSVTGTWSGNATFSDVCTYTDMQGRNVRVPFSATVTVTLGLLDSGGSVSGAAEFDNIPDKNSTCQVTGTLPPIIGPVFGTISGSNLNASATVPGDHGPEAIPLTATVNGMSMALNSSQDTFSLTGTLTQTSTQPPASTYTGTYSGTYNAVIIPCGNPPGIPYSGTMTAGLIQAGPAISGSLTISDQVKDVCDTPGSRKIVHLGPKTFLMTGQVNGSAFTGILFGDGGKHNDVSATISGNTITGGSSDVTDEPFSFTLTRIATGIPAATISTFTANPAAINAGESSTLMWSTINATGVSIDNGIGTQAASGSVTVSPKQTTTYTLTATGPGGSATATTTITVAAAGARIVVGTPPAGMIEPTGTSGATDSFALSNVGTAQAAVTLTQSGNFFAISPASFTIPAGSSQVVGITANAQQAGTYDGTVNVSGGPTVGVHLLVAAPPTAPVAPQATAPRNDVVAPATNPSPTGSVSFKNNGTGTLQGIAVSDVPWIIPQTGVITIAPGQTTTVSFNVDRSKRPDTGALIGGLAGKISLVYLNSVSGKRPIELGAVPVGSVSVTIVDVVKPDVAPGSPPPLATGEVAIFVDGLRTTNLVNGDLSLSSRSSVSDLKMFLAAGGQQQSAAVPAFASNIGVAFPALIRNVFGITAGLGGSLQLRSAQSANISVSAVVANSTTNPALAASTALPILRSDRSIAAAERMVFSGAEVSSSSTDSVGTLTFIQEVSGNAGHVSFEFRDQNGGIVGTDSGAVAAFAAVASDAPAGTRSIIVTNDSTGAARLSGYAIVTANGSGDSWVLTDPTRQWGNSSGALIMPIVAAGSQADVFITNSTNTAVSISVDLSSTNRHHAVRAAGGTGQPAPLASTVPAMSTSRMTLSPTNGFVKINAASGTVSATGRISSAVSGTSIGSSLPVVPASVAIGNGQGKRFTGVDDASAKTIAAATPYTYRSTLMLVETSGQSATVRVTLRYTFVAGSTVSAQAVSSREFALGSNQMLNLADLGSAIIGAQRASFGDLRNMQVDVDVIDGGGRILAFLASVDNASGDVAVRAE